MAHPAAASRRARSRLPATLVRASLAVVAAGTVAACVTDADEGPLGSASPELGRAPASGALDGWTIHVDADRDVRAGTARASVTFDDGGTGGSRSGGVCLVADLGLGACDTGDDCVGAAVAAGYPGSGGAAGWWHYCEPAGGGGGPETRQCWTRPGRRTELCAVGPGALPGSTRTVEQRVAGWPGLEDRPRVWTALACLAGGVDASGQPVGVPAGCGLLTRYLHVVAAPVVVPPTAATR